MQPEYRAVYETKADEQAAVASLWRALADRPRGITELGRDVGLAQSGARPYRFDLPVTSHTGTAGHPDRSWHVAFWSLG